METIVHYEDGWTVKELTEAIQFIENKRNVNVYFFSAGLLSSSIAFSCS